MAVLAVPAASILAQCDQGEGADGMTKAARKAGFG